ncbi:hypothetical protein [Nitrosomonas communis]|uniref:Uncharacterized protein n=1 Tax=Nitrosomonas communis TaxID=44574 RepID=A0A1I4XKB6_9PROT|nr:hypothetical protein [Nitrosomonas communis]SFN25943.1 hypothetical protein SAMN05421863_11612 [Nitrosomonas communis]
MKLSDGKKSVSLSINETLSASELTTLIAELAVIRANMLPEVSIKPPINSDDGTASMQDDPRLVISRLKDNRIRFWLRNAGLSWLIFDIPSNQASSIRDYLVANIQTGTSDLFRDDDGDGNTHH